MCSLYTYMRIIFLKITFRQELKREGIVYLSKATQLESSRVRIPIHVWLTLRFTL